MGGGGGSAIALQRVRSGTVSCCRLKRQPFVRLPQPLRTGTPLPPEQKQDFVWPLRMWAPAHKRRKRVPSAVLAEEGPTQCPRHGTGRHGAAGDGRGRCRNGGCGCGHDEPSKQRQTDVPLGGGAWDRSHWTASSFGALAWPLVRVWRGGGGGLEAEQVSGWGVGAGARPAPPPPGVRGEGGGGACLLCVARAGENREE